LPEHPLKFASRPDSEISLSNFSGGGSEIIPANRNSKDRSNHPASIPQTPANAPETVGHTQRQQNSPAPLRSAVGFAVWIF
jgi:hypothetical protein